MNKNLIVILGLLLTSTHALADGAAGMAPASLGPSSQPALNCDANQFTESSKVAESLVANLFQEAEALKKNLKAADKRSGPDPLGSIQIQDIRGKLHLVIQGLTVPAKICQIGADIKVFTSTAAVLKSPIASMLIPKAYAEALTDPVIMMKKTKAGSVQLTQTNGNLIGPREYNWTATAAAR